MARFPSMVDEEKAAAVTRFGESGQPPAFVLTDPPGVFYIVPVQDSITSTILSSMSDGVLVFDFSGRLMFSNRAGRALLDLGESGESGTRYIDLFLSDPENDAFNDILFSGIQNRETHVHREVPFRRPDGKRMDLAVTTSFLRSGEENGESEGVVVVFTDITESMALNRARERVIEHLSHELKTPLAIIKGTLRRVSTPDNSRFVERIEHNLARLHDIQREVEDIVRETGAIRGTPFRSLLSQMADLLDMVAEKNDAYRAPVELLKGEIGQVMGGGSGHPVALDTSLFVGEIVERVRRLAPHRRVAVRAEIEGSPKITMDPEILRKVLLSLSKNAVEATPDGGEIVIALRLLAGEVWLEVKDTGIGITEESQRQIFGGFYHAKETDLYTTKKPFDFGAGGKGLDLLRLQILSKMYGFRIECESRRCRFIPDESALCPGAIEGCSYVRNPGECAGAGGTVFRLIFPRC